jgi:hypothetical protein
MHLGADVGEQEGLVRLGDVDDPGCTDRAVGLVEALALDQVSPVIA